MRQLHYRIIIICLLLATTAMTAFAQETVLIWTSLNGAELDWFNEKVDEFNAENVDFSVEVQVFADDNQLLATYENNESTEPALLHLTDDGTQNILDRGITQPFSNVVADAETMLDVPVYQSEWFDVVTAHASVDEMWMMVPIKASTAVIYVNLDLLAELGSSVDFVPQDLITIQFACDEIAAAIQDGTIDSCVVWDDTAWLYENWLAQYNTPLVDNGNGREFRATVFDMLSGASVSTVEFMRQLIASGYAFDPSGVEPFAVDAFVEGRIPILLADNTVLLDAEMSFAADVLSSSVDFGWSGARLDTENLWLSAFLTPEVAEAATAFAFYVTSPENNIEWYQATGSLPLTQTAYDMLLESDWAESHSEHMNVFRALTDSTAENNTLFAIFGDAIAIRDAFRFGLNQLILSDVEIVSGLETTQDFVIEQLETYNLTNARDID